MPEEGKETAEELRRAIRDKLSELEDRQLVNKLDIINMKNELDKISLTSAPSPETTEKISELAQLAEKSDKFKRFEHAYADLERLKSEFEKAKPAATEAMRLEMDTLKKKISELESGAPPGAVAPAESKEIAKIKKEISSIHSILESRKEQAAVPKELQERLDELEKSMAIAAASKSVGVAPKQLQEVSKRIERLESRPPATAQHGIPDDVKAEIASLTEKVTELEKRRPSAPSAAKAAGIGPEELQEISKRIERLESRPPATAQHGIPDDVKAEIASLTEKVTELEKRRPSPVRGGIPAGFKSEIASLREKVAKLEKRRPAAVAPGIPPAVLKKVEDIDNVYAEIETLRALLGKQKGKIPGVGKGGKRLGMVVPTVFSKRLKAIERSMAKLELLKPDVKGDKQAIAGLENTIAKLSAKEPGPSIEEVESMLENVRASMEEQGKEILDLHEEEKKRVEESAKRIDKIEKMLEETKELAREDELEELNKDVQILSASIPRGLPPPEKLSALLKDFAGLKPRMLELEKSTGEMKAEAGTAERLDSISNEVTTLKTKMGEVEEKAAGFAMAPDALEELKKMKGRFPVEDLTGVKDRMAELEKKLDKTSKLAAVLKPIELPDKAGGLSKTSTDLERRVKSLEKSMGEGVNPEKIRELENRIYEFRSKLPEHIEKGTQQQMKELQEKMESKLEEMEGLKNEMIESTIEQLLAQPGNVSKLIDKRLTDEVKELHERVEKMSQRVSPADAKLTTLIRDSEDKDKEMEKIKASLKEMEYKKEHDIESLEIEINALNSKLGSMTTSVKGMEGAGAVGVLRDLEILKTKAEWLESTVQKFDLNPIYEKIQELEERLRSAGGYSPVVIE